jgi:hypothetical protein
MGPIWSIRGLVFTGIDDPNNVVSIGVEDLATQGPLVEAQLVELGIPLEAVRIVKQGPVIAGVGGPSRGQILVWWALVVTVLGALLATKFVIGRKKRSREQPA